MSSIKRLPAVMEKVGLSRSKLYADVKTGKFPAPISLGARAVGWLDDELDQWIAEQAAKPRTLGHSPARKEVLQ